MAASQASSRQSSKDFHPSAIVNPKGHLAGDKVGFQDVVAFLKESGNRAGGVETDNAAVMEESNDSAGYEQAVVEREYEVNNAD
jgi:hypothetical protein